MQKWEYLYILRWREIEIEYGTFTVEIKSNKLSPFKSLIRYPGGKSEQVSDFFESMNKLGDEGWELVTSIGGGL